MSAPTIPNLLESLRSSRGGGGGRSARARGSSAGFGPGPGFGGRRGPSAANRDAAVQGTDTDAAVSRLSAVDLDYLDDPYAAYFIQSADGPAPRRLPIINRGTYTRTTALDVLVNSFLANDDAESPGQPPASSSRQIVSLGAGTDTRAFRLFAQRARPGLVYHEIDFETTSAKKLRTVQATPALRNILTDISTSDGGSWTSRPASGGEYHCHGVDLRALSSTPADPETDTSPSSSVESLLKGLRSDIPTLLLSECCLCYLSPSEAAGVLSSFAAAIPNLATVIYEPIKPDDAFGKMMVSNLAARHIRMPTLDVYKQPEDQEARLRTAGFETVRQMTVERIWETWVSPEEKQRLDMLEGLDEVEEWQLLAGHYIVVWGSKGEGFGTWGGDIGIGE